MKEFTQAEALALIATLNFRPFTQADWDGFSGCETASPLIHYGEEFIVVIDGANVDFMSAGEGDDYVQFFSLK